MLSEYFGIVELRITDDAFSRRAVVIHRVSNEELVFCTATPFRKNEEDAYSPLKNG